MCKHWIIENILMSEKTLLTFTINMANKPGFDTAFPPTGQGVLSISMVPLKVVNKTEDTCTGALRYGCFVRCLLFAVKPRFDRNAL